MDKFRQALEEETMQFLILCNAKDAKLLFESYKKKNLTEYTRLACITMVYGYKQIFLRLLTKSEKNLNDFLNELDSLKGNFNIVEGWINGFINSIEDKSAQKLAREYWEERKQTLDKDNFSARQLI